MPFCYAPWTNLDISPVGDIAPCCKFRSEHYADKYNIQTDDLVDYQNSLMLNSVKQDLLNDRWPLGCERCRIEEENSIESKRQLDFKRWQEHYNEYSLDSDKFITTSIAFGNTCNLKCITCKPTSSSRWVKEYQTIYQQVIKPVKFYKQNFVNDFVVAAPNILHLDIPGGEPFLSGIAEQQQLLSYYIKTGRAGNISLHYTTNATVWPDDSWWMLWEHFKEIDIQLSVDGTDEKYEYIRYPAVWSETLSIINQYVEKQKKLDNIRLSISHTVSAYNIFYLDEFLSWCYNNGLPDPWLGRVHTPVHMRPTVWPNSVKEKIKTKLAASQWPLVKPWIKLLNDIDDDQEFEKFCFYLRKHDEYRGLDFKKTFPELAEFI